MAKGIVTITPRSPGMLRVTEIDPANQYRITVNQLLSFERPSFPVVKDDVVEFTPSSASTAAVTRVAVPASAN